MSPSAGVAWMAVSGKGGAPIAPGLLSAMRKRWPPSWVKEYSAPEGDSSYRPLPTNTLAVPSPLVSAMEAEESIPLLVCAGQPGVGVPSDSWKAYTLPLRDPTTTELPAPSRTPGVGDDSRKVAPGMTCSHTRVGLGAAAA